MTTTPSTRVRSFAVAAFLLGRGYRLLGAEVDGGSTVYRFSTPEATVGLREYAAVKKRLDDLADAVRQGIES
jgi:hypothetical protein